MPVPSSYTEDELKTFMVACLSKAATTIKLVAADFEDAVIQTLQDYGVSTIDEATDIAKLRALARVQAWKTALAAVSANISFTDAGATYNRNQAAAMIKEFLKSAMYDALKYNDLYVVEVDEIDIKHDPYKYYPPDERVEMDREDA